MPRLPKDPDERQRRNKAATAATLPSPEEAKRTAGKIPPLSADILGVKGAIKPQVRRWWGVVWTSPMRSRWLDTDVEVLYLVANLRQQMQEAILAKKPIASLAAEIAKQEGRVGLDVLARRRLDWRIEGSRNPDEDEPQAPAAPLPPADDAPDPRRVLRALP